MIEKYTFQGSKSVTFQCSSSGQSGTIYVRACGNLGSDHTVCVRTLAPVTAMRGELGTGKGSCREASPVGISIHVFQVWGMKLV